MSKIEAVIGGKAKGIADQVAIDLALGCKNQCVGCYAKKSCQRGRKYDTVVNKELDKKSLTQSIRRAQASGFNLARVGKHCDPGDHIDSLNGVLDCCNTECFRCIVVSKSLDFNKRTSRLLREGNHILHISFGPYSAVAKNEYAREQVVKDYRDDGVKIAIRLTRDVTQWMSELDQYLTSFYRYIVTPMRYSSMNILNFYQSDPEDFEFTSGYYRPNKVHPSWIEFMTNVCGEINNEIKCCNCLENMV